MSCIDFDWLHIALLLIVAVETWALITAIRIGWAVEKQVGWQYIADEAKRRAAP
ncbi:hypothetical protein RHODGE_RHODGE_00998 [Rhodoplanes serenus]|uniref:Uncharacterized protein n=1 Tax=Rhodoplanes serenus TaxID=200615 RepID=A0A447CNA1_9BRAD|nr:hypothetical protein [Rhodoplanes serenus]VCU06612.1 hypothetical protein RHODPL_RHODPL_00060 [Rhodoplanes serenus]VCU07848.1 hypothetical protein RHODGE_RHODGE_00998 [Rhodoplanes serenus]